VIRLGFGDAFHLPFAPKVGFEFGEDSKQLLFGVQRLHRVSRCA
jgi:hypothetical protein